jgi:hypothetical protein
MSAFDDEFGLFGEESAEGERQSRLPGRRIASSETIIDEVELEEEPKRERRERAPQRSGGRRNGAEPARRRSSRPDDPWASSRRASELLGFLAKRLVGKPDDVNVELFTDEEGQPVIELIVDPEDLGRVIGRSGRVAQALRTIARATAESRVAVDILDTQEAAQPLDADA